MSEYLSFFLFIIGCLSIISSLKALIKATKTSSWKTTSGTITSSKESTILEFSEHIIPRKEPFVEYDYCVEGNSYSNNNVYNIDNNVEIFTKTKKILAKFTPGKNVSVHYNESNPQESYIEIASILPIVLALLFGCCICAIGIMFYI